MTNILRVGIIGAECTGKTTLAEHLTSHYSKDYPCGFVHEELRQFVEEEKRTPHKHEQLMIVKRQIALEEQVSQKLIEEHKNPPFIILFCDTTPLLTAIYSEVIFGTTDPDIQTIAQSHTYDLNLFTQIDFPWTADGLQRDGPLAQTKTHFRILAKLEAMNIPFETISGNKTQRLAQAQQLLKQRLYKLQN